MLQTCHWNSLHFSGYLYINRSWFHLKYTFMALHSVPSCAKSDHLTLISPGYLVQQLSDWNQFVIQYLTVLMIFCMKLFHLNGNKEHFLLSSLMVCTFIGILFPYSNIHLEGGYTPVPTSCPRCPAPPLPGRLWYKLRYFTKTRLLRDHTYLSITHTSSFLP